MAAERQLLDKALARLDDVLAALPQLPPAEDAILAAAAAQAAAKRAKRDPVPEAGIGREGIATPSESDAGSKPRKRYGLERKKHTSHPPPCPGAHAGRCPSASCS